MASSWLTGPNFLWQKDLPREEVKVGDVTMSNDPELRKVQVLSTYTRQGKSLLKRLKFFDWTKMVKAIARLKRRVKEAKGLESRSSETTSLEERERQNSLLFDWFKKQPFTMKYWVSRNRKHPVFKLHGDSTTL